MAGKNIYIGKMITDLLEKIDIMTTTMASQITQLQAINTSVATSIPSFRVSTGVSEVIINSADINVHQTAAPITKQVISNSKGSVTISGQVVVASGPSPGTEGKFTYSTDGGTTKVTIASWISKATGTYPFTVTIAVEQDKVYTFQVSASSNSSGLLLKAGTKILYDTYIPTAATDALKVVV